MKKHLVTLFVFVYLAAFLFSTFAGVVTNAEELQNTDPTEETTVQQDTPSEPEILAPSELEGREPVWASYFDFLYDENRLTLEEPELFVGHIATFNIAIWSTFQYAVDPAVVTPDDENDFIHYGELLDENENGIPVRAVGYALDSDGQLWYKIEAVDGYPLPQVLLDNPYILHLAYEDDMPSLLWGPMKGMLVGETVDILNQPVGATHFQTLSTEGLPLFVDIAPIINDYGTWYDLGDITGWDPALTEAYRYVAESAVIPISPAVTATYEALQNANSAKEFNEIWNATPNSVKDRFTPHHLEEIVRQQDALENVRYETSVAIGTQAVPVAVQGSIPKTGITLTAAAVSAEQVLAEGFDVKQDASDVIAALDIKLLQEDGTEWQPEEGKQVTVTIGMAELGIADETVVSLLHKHGDFIQEFDIFLVLDGKLTLYTNGFSIYVVRTATSTQQYGTEAHSNNGEIELEVGESRIYYFNGVIPNNVNLANRMGTWSVTDTSGAIHYTVHTQSTLGNQGMYCPWLNLDALKATPAGSEIELVFNYRYTQNNRVTTGSESYTLKIVDPVADSGDTLLYLKDDVNATGQLVATLVDDTGKELSLAGAIFTWTRDDGAFISPNAYENDPENTSRVTNQSINIAKDHGGLVEARMNDDKTGYQPTTYTCVATLADGTEKTATYKVYYQSEFINSSFEFPTAVNKTYTYFPNGYPELYWETTAPGTGDKLTMDIEYGEVTGVRTGDNTDDSGFGVEHSAEYVLDKNTDASQFAELNAEAQGALYQDIISVPNEIITWSFRHAPRRQQDWNRNNDNFANKMFVVIGATEDAQKLVTQTQLMGICNLAKEMGVTNGNYQQPAIVTTNVNGKTVTYHVWYHDAGKPLYENHGRDGFYTEENDYGWTQLSGSYQVPEGQYRTRLFFVSDTDGNEYPNFGNLIDSARAGQYKRYLIEYYEASYVVDENGQTRSVFKHIQDRDESGEALIYSFVTLENMEYFLKVQKDYLHAVYINGENYPYSIRYDDVVSMYVEQYDGEAEHFDVTNDDEPNHNYVPNNYDDYEIVMQVTLRDTVIAVQKQIEFPSGMSIEQKLKVITALREAGNGYQATFTIHSTDGGEITNPTNAAYVTHRDPLTGEYFGYISLGENPTLEHKYIVTETFTTEMPGLILKEVAFATSMYEYGKEQTPTMTYYNVSDAKNEDKPLSSAEFHLTGSQKIADVQVTNIYEEKMTRVHYEAVGKGKVQLLDTVGEVVVGDKPSELLAFYSGQANGAVALEGDGATFMGWYTDPACTEASKVTAVNGVYNESAKTFVPNTNIIEADEITFYAKFDTCSIVIERTDGEPNETFVYLVTNNNTRESFYVTVTCDKNGNGSRKIQEVDVGNYTVTEISKWSWRHTAEASITKYRNSDASNPLTFSFNSGVSKQNWLSGWSELLKNIFD